MLTDLHYIKDAKLKCTIGALRLVDVNRSGQGRYVWFAQGRTSRKRCSFEECCASAKKALGKNIFFVRAGTPPKELPK